MPKFSALILFGAILALTSEAGEIIDYPQCSKLPDECLEEAVLKLRALVETQAQALETKIQVQAQTINALQGQISTLEKANQAQQEKIHALESKQSDDLLKNFKVSGEPDKFYPMVFRADAWHEGLFSIEIFHGSEKGKLISQFRCHSSPQTPSSVEIHQQSQKWVADAWCHYDEKNLVVYLRGGETNYAWRANQSTVLLDEMPSNQLAWLDDKPKAILPARGSTTALFNKDDVYAFLPDLKIFALENFSVGGEPDKFYHKVFRAGAEHEGLLSIEIFHASEKGHLISQFKCDSESSVEIHQDSQRWVADAWCSPDEKSLVVFLRGSERSYAWRSNQSGVLLEEGTRGALETMVALFDKNDVQGSLSVIKEGGVFQDRLKDGGFGPEMVWIPAGRFRMGDLQGGGRSNEKPVHEVSVDHFAMSRYEVTFAEYDKFAEATGRQKPSDSGWGRGNRPVINVSWFDATAYAEWLSEQTGQKYRLPTEAEWEYAARAGTETKYWWGNEIGSNKANCYSNYCGDRFEYTAPVGSFAPNPFGLYDTAGNVWEWTCSEYENEYKGKEKQCLIKSPSKSSLFVLRGGSWANDARRTRTAYRFRRRPTVRGRGVGFRLARFP
jgi:formylglycine-generating enzyme required for sulfatase activity/uncharacterized coiled-coil protein SlyX